MVRIRERSFLDLLDLSLVVVRRWPLRLLLATVAGVLPLAAFNEWLDRLPLLQDVSVDAILLPWFEAPLATAPLTVVLGSLMFGEVIPAGRVARILFRSSPKLFVFQVLGRAIFFCIPPSIVLISSRMAFLNEVILLEREPWKKVWSRSAALCSQHGAWLFFQWLAELVFGLVFICFFWVGIGTIGHALVSTDLTWDEPTWHALDGFLFKLSLWLTISFFGVMRFLTYIDQRIRHEGWEVKLRLQAEARKLEEDRPW